MYDACAVVYNMPDPPEVLGHADPPEVLGHVEWGVDELERVGELLSNLDPPLLGDPLTLSPYTLRKANTFLKQVDVPNSVNAQFQYVRTDSDDDDWEGCDGGDASASESDDSEGNKHTKKKRARLQTPVGGVCCVPHCNGNYNKENKVSAFKFPNPDSKRIVSDEIREQIRKQFETWKQSIGRDWPPNYKFSAARVCERHFHESCIKVGPRKKTLLKGSNPTIFPRPRKKPNTDTNSLQRPGPEERREEQAERRRLYEQQQELSSRVTLSGLVERGAEYCSLHPGWSARQTPDMSTCIFWKHGLVFDFIHQSFVPAVLAAIYFTEVESTVNVSVCLYDHTVQPVQLDPTVGRKDTPSTILSLPLNPRTTFSLPSSIVTTIRRDGPHKNPKWTDVPEYFALAESRVLTQLEK
eukprot:comp19909_c0_seq1/m.24139 comp19909_c0_seq1/g.24139  ORF comp19909_c0_seq1/g.24139 comp19909_c0_seq1/m.24139 type:complete len:411 (-) comp19909_c0_seq1:162-1394(-)